MAQKVAVKRQLQIHPCFVVQFLKVVEPVLFDEEARRVFRAETQRLNVFVIDRVPWAGIE